MRFSIGFSVLLLSAIGAVAACSSSESAPPVEAPDAGATDGGEDAGASDEEDADAASAPPPGSDEECAAQPTARACTNCCHTNHQQGARTLTEAIIGCACGEGAAGPCATECATTLCAAQPSNPDPACGACVELVATEGEACFDSISAACESDDDCMASQVCLEKCPET